MNIQLDDVSKIIQLSIAPVFLLSGVGTLLVVLTNRLARIIDRSRSLENILPADQLPHSIELDDLYDRSHLINRSIAFSCICALMICLVITMLFVEDAADINLSKLIAALFVLGILSLTASITYFLREIFVATRTLERDRMRREHILSRTK